MLNLKSVGTLMFAIGITGLAILSFITGEFLVGRPPAWPASINISPVLAYVAGGLLVLASIAICLKMKAVESAILIAVLIFVLSVLRHLWQLMNDWLNTYKALGLVGGALIVAASFLDARKNTRRMLIIFGSVTLAIFFIASGYAHFKFAAFVADFIPSYIPFRTFWAYACGVFLAAGGIGLLIPFTRRWCALMLGVMLSGWFLLLHIPRFLANTNDASDRMGLCESFTFAGICFVLAATCDRAKKFAK